MAIMQQYENCSIKDLPYAILDLETTGFKPENSAVTEVALISVENGHEERFETLIDPQMHIPAQITSITGITDSMVRGMPTMQELLPKLESMLKGKIFVSHNVTFDWAFFAYNFKKYLNKDLRMPSLCTLRLAQRLLKLKSNKLGSVAEHFHVDLRNAHRAMGDTIALKGVLYGLIDVLESRGIKTAKDLYERNLLFLETPPLKNSKRPI